ncbi:hypothetical protein [Macellibacteroides fermentans]|uniref:hypothetical protein n=1 Tax=Macellibacteroides fermentans TaxID=879969 RepID=UPI00406C277A
MDEINKLQGQILEHKSYLFSTDYVVIRESETGEPIPDEVKVNRAIARSEINRLELEIEELEKQVEAESEIVQL